MDSLSTFLDRALGDFGSPLQALAVIIAVALLLMALSRILQRGALQNKGHRFRNQAIMLAAFLVGLLMVILLLPIDTTTRGQLLQLTGIIISAAIALSSGTFISNAMAGIMLKSVRNFRTGDWVDTDGVFGRVSERGLFHTEIQTPDRDLTTLPNLVLATKAVKVVRQSGTIVGATVSLGYDIHHVQVEELLLAAARKIGLEEPFVQIRELGDYSVVYRVAGLLTETKLLIAYRSRLRAAMLDALHEGGVEIVSPLFNNARALPGDQVFIPEQRRRPRKKPSHGAPVDVVFDKAEEAEGLDARQERIGELKEALKELKKGRKAASEEDKAGLDAQLEATEAEIAALEEEIAQASDDLNSPPKKED